MAVITVTAWLCEFPTCGHVWYTAKEPLRCAKCKRKNWNKTGGEVIKPPRSRKKSIGKGTVKSAISQIDKSVPEAVPVSFVEPEFIVQPLEESAAPGWEKPPVAEPDFFVYGSATDLIQQEITVTRSQLDRANSEKPVLPTIVHAPVAERFQAALKHIAEPEHKIGEKCKHGWANWLQCEKCNPKVAQ